MQDFNQWNAEPVYNYQMGTTTTTAPATTATLVPQYHGVSSTMMGVPNYIPQHWAMIEQQHWQFLQWPQQYGYKGVDFNSITWPVDLTHPPPMLLADKCNLPPFVPCATQLDGSRKLDVVHQHILSASTAPTLNISSHFAAPPLPATPSTLVPTLELNDTNSQNQVSYGRNPLCKRPHESTGVVSSKKSCSQTLELVGGYTDVADDKFQSSRNAVKDASKDNSEELSEAEKSFDMQFKQWEEQFMKWKVQNINHPDKTQYQEYETKWENWREKLLLRRERMKKMHDYTNKNAMGIPSTMQGKWNTNNNGLHNSSLNYPCNGNLAKLSIQHTHDRQETGACEGQYEVEAVHDQGVVQNEYSVGNIWKVHKEDGKENVKNKAEVSLQGSLLSRRNEQGHHPYAQHFTKPEPTPGKQYEDIKGWKTSIHDYRHQSVVSESRNSKSTFSKVMQTFEYDHGAFSSHISTLKSWRLNNFASHGWNQNEQFSRERGSHKHSTGACKKTDQECNKHNSLKLHSSLPDAQSSPTPIKSRPPVLQTLLVEDLLNLPCRSTRPTRLVIILRGPPGSGKSFLAKLIKEKELEMGGCAPRILCLDDYFMVEKEKVQKDPDTGQTVISKVLEYEYEAGMDKDYQRSLVKAFRKTVVDGYFPFIIVDCINDKVKHYEEMWSFAKQKGFQVYICQMDMDVSMCSKRNIHSRSKKEIEHIISHWEDTPTHHLCVDMRSLLQAAAITEVEMEDTKSVDQTGTDKIA